MHLIVLSLKSISHTYVVVHRSFTVYHHNSTAEVEFGIQLCRILNLFTVKVADFGWFWENKDFGPRTRCWQKLGARFVLSERWCSQLVAHSSKFLSCSRFDYSHNCQFMTSIAQSACRHATLEPKNQRQRKFVECHCNTCLITHHLDLSSPRSWDVTTNFGQLSAANTYHIWITSMWFLAGFCWTKFK